MEKHPFKRDANEDAAEVVRRSTERADATPEGLEEAWSAWSRRIKATDERTMSLLRASFEAGFEAGKSSA